MKERVKTDPFNTGHYAQKESAEPIDKFSNRPRMKNSGLKDHLFEALSHPKPILPSDQASFRHSGHVQPRGANYHPMGAFGSTARMGTGRGVYSYGGNRMSAHPSNAVGTPTNRRGDNAVGHAPDRHGENAVGHAPNRRGPNAIGNPPNRFGENALAARFVPRGHSGRRNV